MNLYTDHRPRFIPFNLKVEAAARARSVISGSPPTGVAPLRFDANTRYLGTLGLEEGIDVSIFTTFDYEDQQSPFYFFTGTYKLHSQSSALVQFVVHQQKNAW